MIEDLIGKNFSQLTVLERNSTNTKTYWRCLCSCGAEVIARADNLKSGVTRQCPSCRTNDKISYFLEKSSELYEGKYLYPCLENFKLDSNITIVCKLHGEFKHVPYKHLNGNSGCKGCFEESKKNKKWELFLEKSREIFLDFYDYSLVQNEITDFRDKVSIICPSHGKFNISAKQHMLGGKCPKCRIHMSVADFSVKAEKVHNNKYDYSKVVYSGSYEKVIIICKDHGEFLQTPASHFQGSGCSECADSERSYDFLTKYRNNKDIGNKLGYLYLLNVSSENENFIKIGITSNIKKRLASYNRDKNYSFYMIKYWETSNLISAEIENTVLDWKKLNKFHYWPRNNFDGRSECIQQKFQEQLMEFIEQRFLLEGANE